MSIAVHRSRTPESGKGKEEEEEERVWKSRQKGRWQEEEKIFAGQVRANLGKPTFGWLNAGNWCRRHPFLPPYTKEGWGWQYIETVSDGFYESGEWIWEKGKQKKKREKLRNYDVPTHSSYMPPILPTLPILATRNPPPILSMMASMRAESWEWIWEKGKKRRK